MDRETFNKTLGNFKKHLANTQRLARELSEAAISQFEGHGDLSYCQEFFDAMGKNFMRRDAFVKWMVTFSPAMLVEGKWKKDKSDTANKFDLVGAKKVPFWEFAPAKDITDFSAEDLIAQVLKFIGKYENGKKYSPHDDKARALVSRLKDTIGEIAKTVERDAETLNQPDGEQADLVKEGVAEAA